MKYLIALALALLSTITFAQVNLPPTQPPCLPGNMVFKGTGTDYGVFETADMHGEVGWCTSNNGGWRIFFHRWCLKTVCNKAPPDVWTRVVDALGRVKSASNPALQMRAEWDAVGVPFKTPLEWWQFNDWRYQACQWLSSTQPGVTPRPPLPLPWPHSTPLNPNGTIWTPPLDYCNQMNPGPKPPPVSPDGWKALGLTIFKYSNGRLTAPTIRNATKDAACDGATVVTAGTLIYQGLVGGVVDEKTPCTKP